MQTDLFYPNKPGYKAEETSRTAAKRIEPKAATLRSRIVETLKVYPMTADECAVALEESILSVRPRFSELKIRGFIRNSGERRQNESGMKAIVWELA